MAQTVTVKNVRSVTDTRMRDSLQASLIAIKMRLPAADPQSMMSMYRPMKFAKRRSGNFYIETQTATCFDVTSIRHFFMLGVKRLTVQYTTPMTFHILRNGMRDMLTSDNPTEIYSQYIAFANMRGHVLVGGLGLGMAAQMILDLPAVTGVTVVEKEARIIDLVHRGMDPRIKIVHQDLYTHLKSLQPMPVPVYDSAYYDIWYSTGETTWQEHIVPLYRLSRQAGITGPLGAWGEHEMVYQMASSLYLCSRQKEELSSWKPYRVFIGGLKWILGGKPPYAYSKRSTVVQLIRLYLTQIGSPEWKQTFQWEDGE